MDLGLFAREQPFVGCVDRGIAAASAAEHDRALAQGRAAGEPGLAHRFRRRQQRVERQRIDPPEAGNTKAKASP